MTRDEKISLLAKSLFGRENVTEQEIARIQEKTDEQLDYILSPIDQCIYLEACAGSGKTEALGLKAAYEICKWERKHSGLAVLTFTNEAAATILHRVSSFYNKPIPSKHFIGTFASFVHGHIAQRFGYKSFNCPEEKLDKSFKIIESDINSYNNRWLENYKLDFPLRKTKIFANQLNQNIDNSEWMVSQNHIPRALKEIYELDQYSRKKSNNTYLFSYEDLKQKAADCKLKFWADGFATFEDMNHIALKCLNGSICNYITKKFPVILVDECQDLSSIELQILSRLIHAGVTVHYIGDLHQAIYSFKDSAPEYFVKHIQECHFIKKYLNRNFRSTQKIVDFSSKIGGVKQHITGNANGPFQNLECMYVEYTNENDVVPTFVDILKRYQIPTANAVILVRTQSVKNLLTNGSRENYLKHPIINAIQLWQTTEPTARQNALNLLAFQLQKWLGTQGRKNNYCYSEEVCSDSVKWRLLLRDILEALCSQPNIIKMDNITYGKWYTKNKKLVVEFINQHLRSIGKNVDPIWRTPNGTSETNIAHIDIKEKFPLEIETIHSAKGRTFDAVLLISSKDGTGKTGYWENWLNVNEEASRIAYVACTRPRYLLLWAISAHSSDTQRKKLEELGLSKFED